MPYIAFNNGLSWLWKDPSENYQLQAGEVSFDSEPSEQDLKAAFPGYNASANQQPELTKADLLAQIQALMAKVEAL